MAANLNLIQEKPKTRPNGTKNGWKSNQKLAANFNLIPRTQPKIGWKSNQKLATNPNMIQKLKNRPNGAKIGFENPTKNWQRTSTRSNKNPKKPINETIEIDNQSINIR